MNKIILDGRELTSKEKLHEVLKKELDLPDYYGGNLDALWDCLTGWIELPLQIEWTYFEESQKHIGDYTKKVLDVFNKAQKELQEFKITTKN